jgi:hypothetical protein
MPPQPGQPLQCLTRIGIRARTPKRSTQAAAARATKSVAVEAAAKKVDLHTAARDGDAVGVKALVDAGANVDGKSSAG